MDSMKFIKMSGCGNDFIIIDNQSGLVGDHLKSILARDLCRRRHSLGADGLIFVETSRTANIRMDFYNADGSKGEMCGNGLRCFARFVAEDQICPTDMQVETDAGLYLARLVAGDQVQLVMPPVELPKCNITVPGLPEFSFVTVGVPHTVVFEEGSWDWPDAKLAQKGSMIRNHPYFFNGTNVNFVSREKGLKVRTYERGVEAETLACGTGATAVALIASILHPDTSKPVTINTKGGILQVNFQRCGNGFIDVRLQGSAIVVARGEVFPNQ
jgi:diaminopimelate epimerase